MRSADLFANPADKPMATWAHAKIPQPSPAATLPLPPANTNAAAAQSIIDNPTDIEPLQDGNLQLQAMIAQLAAKFDSLQSPASSPGRMSSRDLRKGIAIFLSPGTTPNAHAAPPPSQTTDLPLHLKIRPAMLGGSPTHLAGSVAFLPSRCRPPHARRIILVGTAS
jgi:hypothetical protein